MSRRKADVPESAPTPILLLTVPQVAEALGLGLTKVYDLINYEGLPYVPFGDLKRVHVDSLREWVKQREQCNLAWNDSRPDDSTNGHREKRTRTMTEKGPISIKTYERPTKAKQAASRPSGCVVVKG